MTTTTTNKPWASKDASWSIPMLNPDSLGAAVSHLRRNWGEHGYRLGIVRADGAGGAVYAATASDGSEFFFYVDRYGNATDDVEVMCKTCAAVISSNGQSEYHLCSN